MLKTGVTVFCCLLVVAGAASAATPESDKLVIAGVEALEKKRNAEALSCFERALAIDSRDAEAHFFRGFALNELDRPADAIEAIERSYALGGRHPQMPYEKGRAYFRLERWFDAAREFEAYERGSPGQAATSVWLGRTYLFLGEIGKAETSLREAIRRDASLEPDLAGLLAVVAQYRIDPKGSRAVLEEMRRVEAGRSGLPPPERQVEAPDPEPERLEVEPEPDEKPADTLTLTARFDAGYNSNAIILGFGRELPQGVTQKHAAYVRGSAGFRAERKIDPLTTVSAGYSYTKTVFDTFEELEQDDNLVSVGFRRYVTSRIGLAVGGTDRYTQVGKKGYWNRVGVRPSVSWWHARTSVAELSYEEAQVYYFPSVSRVFNRDGSSGTWTLADYWTLEEAWPWGDRKLKGRLGATLSRHHTDGDDFDSEGTDYWAGLTFPLPGEVALELSCARLRERYDHVNSRADVAGTRRRDTGDVYDIQLSMPLGGEGVRGFVRYGATDNDSNVSAYNYNQYIASFGIEVKM